MDRIYTPSALYPQTLEPQLKLGTATKSVEFFFSLYRVAQSQPCVKDTGSAEFRWTKTETQCDTVAWAKTIKKKEKKLNFIGAHNCITALCVCLCVRKWMAKLVRGFGGGWWGSGGGHVILVSNHERQVQVLVASCVCEKPEKAEVKAIKCAKCCKTAHNRQRRQQF